MFRNLKFLLLFFCFFPFLGLNIGTDTQPFALVLAFAILVCNRYVYIYYRSIMLIVIGVLAILCMLSFTVVAPFEVCKRMFSYISIIVIPIAVYNSFTQDDYGKIERCAKLYIWLWFFVGFVQTFINRGFLTFLIPLSRTSLTRGVCSLASEPSFYGYMCFLFFVFSLDFKKNRFLYCILSVIQVVIFAQSSVTLVYFVVFAVTMSLGWIVRKNPKYFLYVLSLLVVMLFLTYIIVKFYSMSRMGRLLISMLENPTDFLESDKSVNSRWKDILLSLSRYGVPYYLGTVVIKSGFGGAFYELGLFSMGLFYPIMRAIWCAQDNISKKIGITNAVFICMFSAINLSSPMFAFYIGFCCLKSISSQSIIDNCT